jgi:hypothetical protein
LTLDFYFINAYLAPRIEERSSALERYGKGSKQKHPAEMAEKAEIRRQKIRPPGFVNDFNCLRRPGWRRIVESEIRRKSAEIGGNWRKLAGNP